MKRNMSFEVKLPKGLRLKDIRISSVPLDDSWETIVHEGYNHIDTLPLREARRKYG